MPVISLEWGEGPESFFWVSRTVFDLGFFGGCRLTAGTLVGSWRVLQPSFAAASRTSNASSLITRYVSLWSRARRAARYSDASVWVPGGLCFSYPDILCGNKEIVKTGTCVFFRFRLGQGDDPISLWSMSHSSLEVAVSATLTCTLRSIFSSHPFQRSSYCAFPMAMSSRAVRA